MRRILFIIPLLVLMGLCGCRSTQSLQSDYTDIRDSVRIKDSVNIRDSLVLKTSVKDSVRIKDSTVLIVDAEGNVKGRETWHERDHYHYQSDSLNQYKLMLKEALLERDKALQHKEKEVIIKEPSLFDKLKNLLTGFGAAAIVFFVMWLLKKDFFRKNE